MKRFLPLLLVFFVGCSARDPAMEAAMDLRSRCLGSGSITFEAEICADYITNVERFTLACAFDSSDTMSFTVMEPEDIAGIRGTVTGTEGTVRFDDTVLGFPLMADGRLSPVSGPWVLLGAISSGAILAAGQEGELVHVTIDDSYADNALTVDIWLEDGEVEEAEIAWEGRRCLTMTVDDFAVGA